MENDPSKSAKVPDPSTPTDPTATHKPCSPARLAANRANAKKSTGPRTPAGKARSASNSLKHGLFSLANFENYIHNTDLCLAVVDNLLQQYEPVTPIENILVHHLIHFELRFLQMEHLLNVAMNAEDRTIVTNPAPLLPLILRELERLPNKINRTIRAIQEEKARRNEKTEIEAIEDQPPLPDHNPSLAGLPVVTPQLLAQVKLEKQLLFERFAERILDRFGDPASTLSPEERNERIRHEATRAVDAIYSSLQKQQPDRN
ncbi:hypothetical protein [Bryobacter aggregatus]|uniref:hypothetical protein n=1 Tax=Bryobacter aggregatus TaxID=360054 RepID=UPI0004E1CFE3|nr:hypothetical protein [Bryobacter aggregatus]